jgi:DNA (cytosine-5)-methyltransferase 1
MQDLAGSSQRAAPRLRLASFFSGIGGVDLGFDRAGFETVYQNEIKPFCREVLDRHWPGVERSGDIRSVNVEDIPAADVWAAGFPCQDLSLARMGDRSGLRGSQSGLFFEFVRLARSAKPRVILLENVHGLLSSHGGRDFAIVLKTLDELGYGLAWRVLNSKDFGVPQQRRRVFLVGVLGDGRSAGEILFVSERSDRHTPARGSDGKKAPSLFQTVVGDPSEGPLTKALAHCIYAESARHTGTDWSRNYVWYPDGRVRRLTPGEVERAQGFPEGWTLPGQSSQYDVNRLDSLRYHAVGNSVTPQVAEWIGTRTLKVMSPLLERGPIASDLTQHESASRTSAAHALKVAVP